VRDLQETLRNQDKEYQKLKACTFRVGILILLNLVQQSHCDKIKRKALLAPPQAVNEANRSLSMPAAVLRDRLPQDENQRHRTLATNSGNSAVDLGAVVDGMDANGVRTYKKHSRRSFLSIRFYRSKEHPWSTGPLEISHLSPRLTGNRR